jgi:hypothetical protein
MAASPDNETDKKMRKNHVELMRFVLVLYTGIPAENYRNLKRERGCSLPRLSICQS